MTSEEVCQYLTETLQVPVISLGAGNKAHGVHIITCDLFHLYEEHTPRHSKIYVDMIPIIENVYERYRDEVRQRIYPGPQHTVYMPEEELKDFARQMKWESKLAELQAGIIKEIRDYKNSGKTHVRAICRRIYS